VAGKPQAARRGSLWVFDDGGCVTQDQVDDYTKSISPDQWRDFYEMQAASYKAVEVAGACAVPFANAFCAAAAAKPDTPVLL